MEVIEHYTKAQRRAFMRMWLAAAKERDYRDSLAVSIPTFNG